MQPAFRCKCSGQGRAVAALRLRDCVEIAPSAAAAILSGPNSAGSFHPRCPSCRRAAWRGSRALKAYIRDIYGPHGPAFRQNGRLLRRNSPALEWGAAPAAIFLRFSRRRGVLTLA